MGAGKMGGGGGGPPTRGTTGGELLVGVGGGEELAELTLPPVLTAPCFVSTNG